MGLSRLQRLKRVFRTFFPRMERGPSREDATRYRPRDPEVEASRLLAAAQAYAGARSGAEHHWLYRKPFDPSPGNASFYTEMYQVLNLLEAMRIAPGGLVLEVGCGPGWVTEILVLLGFRVVAVEPAAEMVEIARERVAAARAKHHLAAGDDVTFLCTSLETAELEAEAFDAVLFHEALHHVIDERLGLGNCFSALRPGGVLGVSEWAWRPGDGVLEAHLEAEMRRFGTLESPFYPPYLDRALAAAGFVDLRRYHAINGFFPADAGKTSIERLAQGPAASTNNLTAHKPGYPASPDLEAPLSAAITLLGVERSAESGMLRIAARIANTSPTYWLSRRRRFGYVTIALRAPDAGTFIEAESRHLLPTDLPPGAALEIDLRFRLPEALDHLPWCLELVNEGICWFSERGVLPTRVEIS